jgi:hypothetical protein
MGRYSTGAITTGEAVRLELSFLLKQWKIHKYERIRGSLFWNNGSSISFESCNQGAERYIRLYYTLTKPSGEEFKLDYKIQITSIPSNLGRGEVLYFVCPISGRRARILYRAYGIHHFISRQAYKTRIYYSCQICQKNLYDTERFSTLEKLLEKLPPARKAHYQGKETRHQKRIRKLEALREYHDLKRWLIMESYLAKYKPLASA